MYFGDPDMNQHQHKGFSLVEFMVAIALGLLLLLGVLAVLVAQRNTNTNVNGQGAIQDQENAISALLLPIIRGAGFTGGHPINANTDSSLNTGGPAPLGANPLSSIYGYEYTGTGASGSFTFTGDNVANDTAATDWSPSLDSVLAKNGVEPGSDVLTVLGGVPLTSPIQISSIASTAITLSAPPATQLNPGQYAFVADNTTSTVIELTSTTTITGQSVPVSTSTAKMGNSNSLPITTFGANAQVGMQFLPAQQVAFFVGQGVGGEPSLMSATLVGPGTAYSWNITPLISGVETMQVLYGVGAGGVVTQYYTAANVPNWNQVDIVRIGFLLQGPMESGSLGQNQNFNVLGTKFVAPVDTRLRHVFEMSIAIRNTL
jgi:type IV pilus assembly protein PilW